MNTFKMKEILKKSIPVKSVQKSGKIQFPDTVKPELEQEIEITGM